MKLSPGLNRRVATAFLLSWVALAGAVEGRAYDILDFEWTDPARQRPVPVRLYLPQSADAQRPVPLVVFSHGIGGSRQGYRYLGSHWASQGYASLHLQHVGSDRQLWFGNVFGLLLYRIAIIGFFAFATTAQIGGNAVDFFGQNFE